MWCLTDTTQWNTSQKSSLEPDDAGNEQVGSCQPWPNFGFILTWQECIRQFLECSRSVNGITWSCYVSKGVVWCPVESRAVVMQRKRVPTSPGMVRVWVVTGAQNIGKLPRKRQAALPVNCVWEWGKWRIHGYPQVWEDESCPWRNDNSFYYEETRGSGRFRRKWRLSFGNKRHMWSPGPVIWGQEANTPW